MYQSLSVVFFSTSGARTTVPHLQQVYQADAAHMSFGKYTLYSCYGTTANGTTSAVGFGIHFGNESKEDWEIFWNFLKHTHASLDDYKNTLITDQAKGLVESIHQVLPSVGHFHCSYHRRQNILKVVKGGSQPNSCLWLYNKCMKATNAQQLHQIKLNNAVNVNNKALNYLNSIPDQTQYPAAPMGDGIIMYGRSALSSVESMNHAKKAARERTAVDVVNAVILIL